MKNLSKVLICSVTDLPTATRETVSEVSQAWHLPSPLPHVLMNTRKLPSSYFKATCKSYEGILKEALKLAKISISLVLCSYFNF